MADIDGRRRQYVPLDVMIAFGDFGAKLGERWGIEGIGAWMLFLAACKREPVQGTFTFTSDAEAWTKLGATATAFTLDEFFRFTGQHKKTRRRRHGRVSYVSCTSWNTWNTVRGGAQNPSKQAQNTTQLSPDTAELSPIIPAEVEGEAEKVKVNSEVEAEAEGLRLLQGTADLEIEVAGLLALGGADQGSASVARSYAARLPLSTVARIRLSAREKGKGIAWAIAALRDECKEVAA